MLHQYKLNGYNIVLDTCSGAVHAVDDVAYDMIAAWQSTDRETLIRQMLSRYADRPDVTEADLPMTSPRWRLTVSCLRRIPSRPWQELSRNAPAM